MALLEVKNAAFTYDEKRMILEDVNFTVEEGEILCVIGPNGCGKSTLIDCILGLNKLKSGQILVEGEDLSALKPKEFAEHVAYVPQGHKTTFAYTVLDVVTMGRTYAARMFAPPGEEEKAIARAALKQVGLEGFEDREYTKLSGGELQLVIIARAIAQQSKIMVMDEPTAHLDFTHELTVMEVIADLVKNRNRSIIMATHFLNQAYYLENAGVNTKVALFSGKNFARMGKPSDILTEENLESTFNIITEIVNDGSGVRKYILPLRNKR
ncbi:ABC transporter ATP-binding protein [bacterium 210820-DFI.6.37]|nr:ABC transporter ATP-binding protein [bacterium 210820-DFI.6.37]